MPLLLSFCNSEVLPLVNQLGTNPLSKHSFSYNLTLSCKLLRFFNQNPRNKSGPGDLQFGILRSIFFKLPVPISTFSYFLNFNFTSQVLQPLCILLMIYRQTPYISPKVFRFFSHRLIIIITSFFFLM